MRPAPSPAARIDALFSGYEAPRTPGLYVAVVQGPLVVHRRAYGRAELNHDRRWKPRTRIRVASLTKQMVALLAMEMQRDGLVACDARLGEYLHELPPYAASITLDDCLLHLSGLRSDEPIADLGGFRFSSDVSLDALYRLTCRQERAQRLPGAAFEYNDAGYRLVVRWLERRMQRAIDQLLHERLFAPIGMTSTAMTYDEHDVLRHGAARYELTDSGFRHLFWGRSSSGDGGISTTMPDLLRWHNEVLRRPDRVAVLLDPPRRDEDPAPFARRGIFTGFHRGRPWYGHTGNGGCGMFHFPEDDVGVVFVGNRTDIPRHRLAFDIYDALWPERRADGDAAFALDFDEDENAPDAAETLVDPRTGDVVRITRGARYMAVDHFGQKAVLECAPDAPTMYGTLSVRVRRSTERWTVDLGFGFPQQFGPPSATAVAVPHGLYVSPEVGGVLRLERRGDHLFARFAEAPSTRLEGCFAPVGPRTWFDGNGRAIHVLDDGNEHPGLHVHCATARGLRYTFVQ